MSNLPYLKRLDGCVELARLTSIGPLVALHHLNPNYCCSLKSMLDMSHSPQLLLFKLKGCGSLMEFTAIQPLVALEELDLGDCRSVHGTLDSSNFSQLKVLKQSRGESLKG